MQSNTKPLPEIAQNHYELCTVERCGFELTEETETYFIMRRS